MEIRQLRVGDEAVADEACRAFGCEGELDPASFLARPEATLLIAEDDDGLAGWVYGHELVHPDGELTMLLYALDVVERARRRGVGTALVDAFVEHARTRDCTEVWVLTEDTNDPALATYRGAGAVVDPETPVMFAWDLTEPPG